MDKIMSRRRFISITAGAATLPLLGGCARPSGDAGGFESSGEKEFAKNKIIFDDDEYYYELLRTMGHSYCGSADINECLMTAHRITDGDDESWYREWTAMADRVFAAAEKSEKGDHPVSAREGYMRASNYYRTAEFFLHADPTDPRINQSWRTSRDSFRKAIPYLPYDIRVVQIPYEGTTLPGYFVRAEGVTGTGPILIIHPGFDGTAEEALMQRGLPAVRRGYHCLAFEGPGQGGVIREQRLVFRPDWEKVIGPVIDFALKIPGIDSKKITVYGVSFGGFLAPRAAVYEKRIAVCIANSGIYSLYEPVEAAIPGPVLRLRDSHPDVFGRAVRLKMKVNGKVRWFINDALWKFGASGPADLFRKLEAYTLDGLTDRITCTMLVCDGEEEHLAGNEAKKLYDALVCPKEYMLFTSAEGAGTHSQNGAEAVGCARIYDWLDGIVGKGASPRSA